MTIFVNRELNLNNIKAIGLDMDYTLVRYYSKKFEEMAFYEVVSKLYNLAGYPAKIKEFEFDFNRAIKGLVLDKERGNILKLTRYGKVVKCLHGTKKLSYEQTQKIYNSFFIDLGNKSYYAIDTSFSISTANLFSLLVDLKDEMDIKGINLLPSYKEIHQDIIKFLDLSHADGSLKNKIEENLSQYIIQDLDIPQILEKFKDKGKILMLITNSDYHYTKLLLDFTLNPHLNSYDNWMELFDYVITSSEKPSFFTDNKRFLKVHPESGMMTNWSGQLEKGIYQGGSVSALEKGLQLSGGEILYIGDHIYGDVVKLKKSCNWRTALVIEELQEELKVFEEKSTMAQEIDELYTKRQNLEKAYFRSEKKILKDQIDEIEKIIIKKVDEYQAYFNQTWGQLMRAGNLESRFSDQIQRYACIYMSKLSDLVGHSAKHIFRAHHRPLPHEK